MMITSRLSLIAALLCAAASPAAPLTYAAGHVTATPLPPPAAKPHQDAPDPPADEEPSAPAAAVVR